MDSSSLIITYYSPSFLTTSGILSPPTPPRIGLDYIEHRTRAVLAWPALLLAQRLALYLGFGIPFSTYYYHLPKIPNAHMHKYMARERLTDLLFYLIVLRFLFPSFFSIILCSFFFLDLQVGLFPVPFASKFVTV